MLKVSVYFQLLKFKFIIMNCFKNWSKRTTNIYESICPFYYLSKCFGLAPYHINYKTKKIETFLSDTLMFFVILLIYISSVVSTLHLANSYNPKNLSESVVAGQKMQFLYLAIMTLSIVVYNFIYRENIVKFLMLMFKYDEATNDWKHRVDHSKCQLQIILCLLISILSLAISYNMIVNYVLKEHSTMNSINCVVIIYETKAYTMTVFQFIFSAHCVQIRIKNLIKNINLQLMDSKFEILYIRSVYSNKSTIVQKVTFLHDLLIDAVDEINNVFSIQVMLISILIVSIQLSYFFYSLFLFSFWSWFQ